MFVRKSRYEELRKRFEGKCEELAALGLKLEFEKFRGDKLLKDWNELVSRINAKGGEDFLRGKASVGRVDVASGAGQQFTQEELKKLVMLCHPDKHNGSKIAGEITAKLLKLRG